ncbi:MAG: 50S ribosomal protein L18 [Patescibacteria group bacterium]
MNKSILKNKKTARRQARTRSKIKGTDQKPRLCVFRSNAGMYLQLIDDLKAITLVSAHSREIKAKTAGKIELASALGKLLAQKAADKKIKAVVFDRGSYKYHGRVKAAAEGAREGGLEF